MILHVVLALAAGAVAPVAPAKPVHHFYDHPAKIELAIATTSAAFDIGQTCHNLANGGREYWIPTQHCPQITLLVLGGVAAQESLAYVFHRTGHHKLERLIRLVTIEENTRAIIYSKQHGAW